MAATDLERLVVQLSADLKGYQNSLNKARGITNRQLGQIQKQASSTGKAMTASLVQAGTAAAGAFIFSDVLRGLGSLSEAATRIDNSLKVAGLSGAELERVYEGLSKAALANGAPIETLASLYGKAAQAQKELGVTSAELLTFTNNVALALRVAGTDAQSASGALLQLGQALGSGKVQAEEFNSILEGAPTIAQAAAAGLKEAGGSVSQLKQLVVDGQISSEAFFRAFEAGSVILAEKAARATQTIGQATTNLYTALTNVTREFNQSTGASQNFAQGVNSAATAINNFDVSGLIQKIKDAKNEFDGFLNSLGNAQVFKDLNELLGVANGDGNAINIDKEQAEDNVASLEREVKTLQDRIKLNTELGFDNGEAIARLNEVLGKLAEVRAAAASMPDVVGGFQLGENGIKTVPAEGVGAPTTSLGGPRTRGGKRKAKAVAPVSLVDLKPPSGGGGGGGGGGKRGGGGGGGGANEFQRETEQIRERTEAIRAETEAQAGLNPLIDDYGYTLEFAASKQDLLNAAKQAGLTITPELEASINALAEGYARASAGAEELAQSQEDVRRAADDFKNSAKDITGGFISDLRSGKSAAEALASALDKVVDKLIDVALNSVFGTGGGSGGGILGGLFGGIFGFAKGGIAAHGRPQPLKKFARGGVSRSAAIFGEAGPEAAVPLPDGRSIPVKFQTPAVPKRSASGGAQAVHVTVGVSANNNGNLLPFVEEVSQKTVTAASPRIISAANQNVVPVMAAHQRNKAGGEWR